MLLGERSQSVKATWYCMVSTTWRSGKSKTMEAVKRSVVARGWGDRGWIDREQGFLG